jgi:glycosyltransferase involved in cell wall biosynthesis
MLNRWRLVRWLSKRVARREIELIEAPEYEGMLAFGNPGCPVAVRLHLSGTTIQTLVAGRAAWTVQYCERRTLDQHRNWIGVTNWMLNHTVASFGLVPNKRLVIYNPAILAPAAELLFDLPDQYVLYAGTVSERKGACVLAEAAAQFLREQPALHLVYAGALDSSVDIRQQIEILLGPDLLERVHFLGRLDRSLLATCMRKATVFVSPSRLEACSLVTIEAMLAGLPVIVPAAGPFPELVTNGETGCIVPPDDPAAIAQAVARLIRNPELRARLGRTARLSAEARFSLPQCLAATETFYQELIEQHGRYHSNRVTNS